MIGNWIRKIAGVEELQQQLVDVVAEKDKQLEQIKQESDRLLEEKDAKLKELEEQLNAKDEATRLGKPYVRIINVDIDDDDPGEGAFELEWNEIFVKHLQEAGYSGNTPEEIVDQWFTFLCRGIAEMER